jgi:hypothetical protein
MTLLLLEIAADVLLIAGALGLVIMGAKRGWWG